MKYKLRFDYAGDIILVDDEGEDLVCIFWRDALKNNYLGWPEGFWYSPDWCLNDKGASRDANVDYHEHRDEYIMEAKKLMVKSML